ncbi:MAG: threonylcarbamoyl-AMP synthase [SAR202 cluster bacterium Casp-Chloro-G4]|nr:L-threonylcarbamoyladenylate synthase [Chloroflexota bacterium]MDA1228620.1 L-threonylcarbamoyladenylate synthase [Chloroflexota bacterium]PKB61980.1 MAG: threonylcarbamoyl-AMP synthase [SAR202 cluster bacterium Casp-Chloro-G4]
MNQGVTVLQSPLNCCKTDQIQASIYDILFQAENGNLALISTHNEALQSQIAAAVDALKRGGVVGIPTDTLYGLAACVFDDDAVRRVFDLKGRPANMPMPVLLARAGDMGNCVMGDVPEAAIRLAERFWPGALTLVLKRSTAISDIVSAGGDTVALRVPNHPVPRQLAEGLGAPITGTSANRSGEPGLTTAKAVRYVFGDELEIVVEAGEILGGVASTVLDLSGGRPVLLRQGAVSQEDIEDTLGVNLTKETGTVS